MALNALPCSVGMGLAPVADGVVPAVAAADCALSVPEADSAGAGVVVTAAGAELVTGAGLLAAWF